MQLYLLSFLYRKKCVSLQIENLNKDSILKNNIQSKRDRVVNIPTSLVFKSSFLGIIMIKKKVISTIGSFEEEINIKDFLKDFSDETSYENHIAALSHYLHNHHKKMKKAENVLLSF